MTSVTTRRQLGMFWLQSQLSVLLLRCFRVLWPLVLISTTSDAPQVSRFWIVGLTRGTRLEARSLPMELMTLSASVVDRKIYVAGIHGDSLKNSSKVLDTRTQIWDHVLPIPCNQTTRGSLNFRSVCIDGKSHVATDKGVVCYNPTEGKWDLAEAKMRSFWFSDCYCEIENVLYSFCKGEFRWYDSEVNIWRNFEGLVGLPKFLPGVSVRLADYGGKMAVLWDENRLISGEKLIWCAEIALKRRSICLIWGKVEWIDHVLTVPIGYYIVKALAATV